MSILVTGGLGYVGSHCVKALKKQNEDIIILDNLEYGHKAAALGINYIIGDIADKDLMSSIFEKHDIEAVLHFAAYRSVGESVKDPQKYYKQNIAKSIDMLEVMNKYNCKMMIFSSTAATFGEPEYTPIDEKHPQKPTNPYGSSKLMLETVLKDYESIGLRSISLRYFNAAGADPDGEIGECHIPEEHIIPIIFQTLLGQREKVYIFGNDYPTTDGTCVRDYIHVNDLAKAHILALAALRQGHKTDFYNMGNGNGFSVLDIIKTTEEITGLKVPYEFAQKRAGDPAILIATSEKITKELGYSSDFSDIKDIIRTAWNWHKSHPKGFLDN